ncbi:GrpB family protein [Microbacterium sp. 1.5R]|uniref:GrpB family protein n=1 Tax=Microbacterium sp. 1.5R TaxID=1916917 RepID=UPI0011A7F90A|nr:GrpB family protein [Microbacterium sp. 1.5R]
MPRMLVDYDPAWPSLFAALADGIRSAGDGDWIVEHIGSTAVPGMRAKPVIDLAIRIRDHEDFEARRPDLEASGWALGSSVTTHPVMVRESDGIRSAIAHFFTAAEWDTVNQRILRDWLRENPADAARYARAKCGAVAAAARGISSYNAAKTPVIQDLVDAARDARGLPSVPVSDKHVAPRT